MRPSTQVYTELLGSRSSFSKFIYWFIDGFPEEVTQRRQGYAGQVTVGEYAPGVSTRPDILSGSALVIVTVRTMVFGMAYKTFYTVAATEQ